jgi:hypothetical protein
MALWDLLTAISFLAAPVAAVQTAHAGKISATGYAVAVVMGSAIGVCCTLRDVEDPYQCNGGASEACILSSLL